MNLKQRVLAITPGKLLTIAGYNTSFNICHQKKIIFVHNPKCAGTSIKQSLGIDAAGADHRFPTELATARLWEDYFSFTVVRHPLDRFISSYSYHTSSKYQGYYFRKYPGLHNMSMEEYFNLLTNAEEHVLAPNTCYTQHHLSRKKPNCDFVCRFETLQADLQELSKLINISFASIPHKNPSKHNDYHQYLTPNSTLMEKCTEYYSDDFDNFSYRT